MPSFEKNGCPTLLYVTNCSGTFMECLICTYCNTVLLEFTNYVYCNNVILEFTSYVIMFSSVYILTMQHNSSKNIDINKIIPFYCIQLTKVQALSGINLDHLTSADYQLTLADFLLIQRYPLLHMTCDFLNLWCIVYNSSVYFILDGELYILKTH